MKSTSLVELSFFKDKKKEKTFVTANWVCYWCFFLSDEIDKFMGEPLRCSKVKRHGLFHGQMKKMGPLMTSTSLCYSGSLLIKCLFSSDFALRLCKFIMFWILVYFILWRVLAWFGWQKYLFVSKMNFPEKGREESQKWKWWKSQKSFLKLSDGWKLVCNADHVRSRTPRWFLNFQRKAKPREGSDHEMDLKERVEDAILCRFKWSLLPFSLLSAILCLRLPMHRPNVGQLPKNHCQQV